MSYNINWSDLRPWQGSQHTAFEELCCQLAASEPMPPGAWFRRKGAPDAGVECYWMLPSRDEIGWQAKFFQSTPNDSQWQQLDKSVRTALDKHPRLVEYIICLPIDRSDPRLKDRTSFMKRWDARVATWESWASERSMQVTFSYWGEV